MNILVIGSGGREHALAWKIAQSPKVETVYVAPGNAGTARDAVNVPIRETDFPALIEFAMEKNVKLTVVGPETPLVLGIVDAFEKKGLRIFGPRQSAAQIEGSKVFCKEILKKGNVPTALYHAFDNAKDALAFLTADRDAPMVVKADGLAAGKGVFVCENREEAIVAISRIAEEKEFGTAGNQFILEEKLTGREASVLAFTDGKTIVSLQPAQDHKAAYDGDKGPNTGGMGAYTPATWIDDAQLHRIEEHILVPTVHALKRNATPFSGVLYAGLMMSPNGPKVLEYNARFGDPECQPLLMRLKTDLVELMEATVEKRLDRLKPLQWDRRSAVCVVLASRGYPGPCEKGFPISGLDEVEKMENVKVFHSGTILSENGEVCSNGGRVLAVCALGECIARAKELAYEAVKKIHWDGMWFRTDISDKAGS